MRSKSILYALIPVALIGGAAAYHLSQRNAELGRQAQVKSEGLLAVTLVPVEERPFRPAVAFTGTLLAVNRAELKAEVGGRVTRVAVQEGDSVAAGALLGAQDEDDYLLGVRAAEAQLAQAQAQALQAQRDNDRAIALLEKRSVTRQFAQQAETAHLGARAAVQAAESNLGLARLRLKKARLVAPFAGQVARRLVQPGEMLAPGQSAFEVVDNRRLEIQANLSSEALGLVKPGLAVTFRASGIDRSVAGRLTQVSPSLSQDGRTLRVRIEVPNPEGQLKGGLFVEGVILGEGEVRLPSLPATLLKAEGRDAELFVAQLGVAHRRKVSLGVEQGGFRPVQGLDLKDLVIDSGKDLVGDGTRLRVVGGPASGGK
jgi:membrane fusion protein, multidrug efflux system